MSTEKFLEALDAACVEELSVKQPRRKHLGASQIGGRCARAPWLNFRWVKDSRKLFDGRILRLFNRGHSEETRVARWLGAMGIEILGEASGDTTQQQSFEDHGGHYSGSGDGEVVVGTVVQWFGALNGNGLLEVKTANDKYFTAMVRKGVKAEKFEHYVQMQQYMRYFGLTWALYICVNKNTDAIYPEIVHYDEVNAKQYSARARNIIEAQEAPPKVSSDPSWFGCKFCDHRELCHYGGEIEWKNCRSCAFASPVVGKQWHCGKWDQIIPDEYIENGCDKWEGVL